MKYDTIISINVHEKPEYFKTQLENIKENVKLSYNVIVNCNDYMYSELKKEQLNIIINPETIEKRTFHGSLTKGIFSNKQYVLNANIEFDYFIVMSSRTFFYQNLKSFDDIKQTKQPSFKNYTIEGWHWPSFKKTKLFEHIQNNNMLFGFSYHEGLCFNYETAKYIVNFLENNSHIKEDLFNFEHCVEEFSLQSIACNCSEYYNIGNGIFYTSNDFKPDRFTHKKDR